MGKSTLEQAVKAQKKSSTALLFFEPRRWEVVGGEFLSPSRLSLEKDSVPIVQEAGRVQKILLPTGFDPRTVQLIASPI